MNNIKEQLEQLRQKIIEAIRTLISHPWLELKYNSWLQLPKDQRKKYLIAAKIIAGLFFLFFFYSGASSLIKNQLALWKGNHLFETMAAYQIESSRLKAEIKSYADVGGIYKGKVDDLLLPVYSTHFIHPSTVRSATTSDTAESGVTTVRNQMEMDRITVRQLVEVLFALENAGANLAINDLSMAAIEKERGWYKATFTVSQALPKEEAP